MKPYYEKNGITIVHGKAEDVLEGMPGPVFGTLVMDPPYTVTPENISPFLRLIETGGRALVLGKGSYSILPHIGPEADCVLMPEIAARMDRNHPVARPVEAMKTLLSLTEGWILDPYMGAGATLIAARQLGREAFGIEIEKTWCDIAIERLDALG